MSHPTPRAALRHFVLGGLAVFVLFVGFAQAGTVLLSRESMIRASGNEGSDDVDLLDSSQDFYGFADAVKLSDAGVTGPRAAANQNSRPTVDEENGTFVGAYAEGAASAKGLNQDLASALSNFDLSFEVTGVPSMVSFGGAVGIAGDGSAIVALSNQSTGEILLSEEVLPGETPGAAIDHSTVLQPGVYKLSVEAEADGQAADSMAYYTMSLSIAAVDGGIGGGGTNPIPLPPAALSIGAMLGAGAVVRGVRHFRAKRSR